MSHQVTVAHALLPPQPTRPRTADRQSASVVIPAALVIRLPDGTTAQSSHRVEDVDRLRQAPRSDDFGAIERLGHNMKEAGAGYGFLQISDIGATREGAGRRGDRDETRRWIEALELHLEEIAETLARRDEPST